MQATYPEKDSMYGIFRQLKSIDKKYFSRYSIEANLSYGTKEQIVNYYEKGVNMVYTQDNSPYITVNFNTPLYITNYSIVNAYYEGQRTFPTEWIIEGKYRNNQKHVIDYRNGYFFCERATHCSKGYVKTFSVNKTGPFSSLTIKGIANSDGNPYLILSSLEFFGILCSRSKCIYPLTCNNRRNHLSIRLSKLLFIVILFSIQT